MHRPTLSILLFSIILMQGVAIAADSVVEGDDLAHLLTVLDEQTEIATKSRLNADFVPGIVTVLRGRDLEPRGVRNVWEALSLVPGIELGMEETGRRHIMIRGVGLTYASEAAKLMVNGVSYNTTSYSFADAIFNIPIGQVERIEVIRGPGSALYGEFAYSGVVNVITYQGDSRLFAQASSRQERMAGGIYSFGERSRGHFYGTLNVAAENSGNVGVASGYDAVYQMDPSWSYSPGQSNEVTQTRSAMLDLGYDNLLLKMAWLSNGTGDHFGINRELPPSRRIVTTDQLQSMEVSISNDSNDGFESTITLGKRSFKEEKDRLFLNSANSYCYADPVCLASSTNDVVGDISSAEQASYLNGDLSWRVSDIDTLYLAVGYTDITLDEATMRFNIDPVTYYPTSAMYDWSGINPLERGIERHIVSATLQNEHDFTAALRTTVGLRYDNYNDVGDSLTPRLAGVWTLDSRNLLKAQYSSAFRPPTFYEMGGAIEPITPSTVDTYELSYIARSDTAVARLTGYHSHLKEMITFVDNGVDLGYANSGSVTLRGIEMEYEQRIGSALRVDGNISLLRAHDDLSGQEMPNTATRLGNLALTYTPSSRWMLNGKYRYVGPRSRDSSDTRQALAAYQTLDITMSMPHVLWKGMTVRGGVRNLLDADIRYPAPAGSYPDDYPRPGRYWWGGMQFDY